MDVIKEIIVALAGNPVAWGVFAVIGLAAFAMIAKKTKTKLDDQILAMLVHAFDMAEKVIPDASKGILGKTDAALKTFKDQYIDRYGKKPPDKLMAFAKDQWAILAHELKKK